MDTHSPLGIVWHATQEAISHVKDHRESPLEAFAHITHIYKLSHLQKDQVWERLLEETED